MISIVSHELTTLQQFRLQFLAPKCNYPFLDSPDTIGTILPVPLNLPAFSSRTLEILSDPLSASAVLPPTSTAPTTVPIDVNHGFFHRRDAAGPETTFADTKLLGQLHIPKSLQDPDRKQWVVLFVIADSGRGEHSTLTLPRTDVHHFMSLT